MILDCDDEHPCDESKQCAAISNIYTKFNEIFGTSTTSSDNIRKCVTKLDTVFEHIDNDIQVVLNTAAEAGFQAVLETFTENTATWLNEAPQIRSGKHGYIIKRVGAS